MASVPLLACWGEKWASLASPYWVALEAECKFQW